MSCIILTRYIINIEYLLVVNFKNSRYTTSYCPSLSYEISRSKVVVVETAAEFIFCLHSQYHKN